MDTLQRKLEERLEGSGIPLNEGNKKIIAYVLGTVRPAYQRLLDTYGQQKLSSDTLHDEVVKQIWPMAQLELERILVRVLHLT